jgi:cytochrome c peroxidase
VIRRPRLAAASLALVATAVHGGGPLPVWLWKLPPGFRPPAVPAENPMSRAKIELGRRLFFDPRLSGNGTQSCATCHRPELAFTDGRARALGSTGEEHPRSTMSLANVAWSPALNWASEATTRLEDQARTPLMGRHPIEMGMPDEATLLGRLRADPDYARAFPEAFPEDPFTLANTLRALAAFQRTLVSGRSAYDRLLYDDEADALSPAARRGMDLFFGDRLNCARCHHGRDLGGPRAEAGQPRPELEFHDTAVASVEADPGLAKETGHPEDRGRFRAPSLRNVAVTAPYMHDGSLATLEAVVGHYAAGGAARASRPTTPDLEPFEVTEAERADVVAFLESLTDEAFLRDPRYRDPWSVAPSLGSGEVSVGPSSTPKKSRNKGRR